MGKREGMAHQWVDVRGLRLHCVEAGAGPLVVLLHGFPEFWYAWRHQILALADAGYRVVAPDLRGYNTSDKPPGCATTDPRCWPRRWPT
jgi:epoxide hydrolase 4